MKKKMTVTQMKAIAQSITERVNKRLESEAISRKASESESFIQVLKDSQIYKDIIACEDAAAIYEPYSAWLKDLKLQIYGNDYYQIYGSGMLTHNNKLSEIYIKTKVNAEFDPKRISEATVYREVMVAEPSCETVEEIIEIVTNYLTE